MTNLQRLERACDAQDDADLLIFSASGSGLRGLGVFRGLWLQGSGFRVLRVQGFGFGGLGFQGLGFRGFRV